MENTFSDPLLEPAKVAEYLQVTPAALEKWRIRKRGPAFIRVGRQIRYRQSDLDRWLRERTVASEVAA